MDYNLRLVNICLLNFNLYRSQKTSFKSKGEEIQEGTLHICEENRRCQLPNSEDPTVYNGSS